MLHLTVTLNYRTMRTAKKIGLAFLAFVLILVIVAFLLPGKMQLERTAVMQASQPVVYEQINTLKNWENWSPWHKLDPDMQLFYTGPASGKGAAYRWASENDNVGNGRYVITDATPNERIEANMYFMDSKEPAKSIFILEPHAKGTLVKWQMESEAGNNPIMRYMNLIMKSYVEKDFDRGLQNLQNIVEKEPAVTILNSKLPN